MGMTLRCTLGPCLGQSIAVDSELVLGREEPDPGHLGGDARLSRRHARLSVDERGRAVIEDLESTNGTWVNDERLSAPHVCVTGDILRVGQSTFELEVAPPPAAPTEPEMPVPRSAPTVAEMPALVPESVPELRVTAGPRQGEEIPLDHELLIGRSYGEPGALGGDRRLSRRHARIARGPGGVFFIEDTGSSNGTRVNGAPLRRPRALRDADEIEIGSSTLVAHGFPAVSVGVEAAESMSPAPEVGEALGAAAPAAAAPAAAAPAAAALTTPAAARATPAAAPAAPPPPPAAAAPRRRSRSHRRPLPPAPHPSSSRREQPRRVSHPGAGESSACSWRCSLRRW